jgi:hypothetical protein
MFICIHSYKNRHINISLDVYIKVVPKVTPEPESSLMTVIVSVVNPRILLLEDPESIDSRAIVLRCGVTVQYSNDSKVTVNSVTKSSECAVLEDIQVSVLTLELFSVTGLTHGR